MQDDVYRLCLTNVKVFSVGKMLQTVIQQDISHR
jgi:hypothetical protein